MKKLVRDMPTKLVSGFVIVSLIIGYFYLQVDWNARAIRKQFSQLIELVEKEGAVSKFESVGRSRKLPGFFTDNASIEYFPNRRLPKDRDAMSGAFLSVWGQIDTASVSVLRHAVDIDEDALRCESNVVVRSSVIMNGSEKMGDTLKYRIYWRKIGNDWRIEEVIALDDQ